MITFRLPDPPLADGVVALRAWTPDDVQAITDACQDPDIARWIQLIPQPYTLDHAREYVEQSVRNWTDGTGAPFAITDASSGEVIGSIGAGPRTDTVAEVGYWVRADARGRGAATRALILVSRWVLSTPGLLRLQLRTDAGNVRSQRVAERAGFVREGLLRANGVGRDGSPRDECMFSLLPGDA